MADLTDDERVRISTHLGWAVVSPLPDYVTLYLNPALERANESDAVLTLVRARLAEADAAWAKYTASLTKQELKSAGSISFHERGEKRLLKTHRIIARTLASVLGVRTNYTSSGCGGGGLKYT